MTFIKTIQSILDSYCQGFENYDIPHIIQHYTFPCTIWHTTNYMFTRNELKESLNLLLEKYKKNGLAKAKFDILNTSALSNVLFQTHVRWFLYNADNIIISEFEVIYFLSSNDGQLKIFNVININEII